MCKKLQIFFPLFPFTVGKKNGLKNCNKLASILFYCEVLKSSHALTADGSPSKCQVLPAVELAGDPRGSPRFSEILPDGWSLEVRGASTKLGDSAFGTLKAFQMHCRTGLGSRVAEYQNK